jgi:hypothetical protein
MPDLLHRDDVGRAVHPVPGRAAIRLQQSLGLVVPQLMGVDLGPTAQLSDMHSSPLTFTPVSTFSMLV